MGHEVIVRHVEVIEQTVQGFWCTWLGRVIYTGYSTFVLYPLRHLYLRFYWGGKDSHDICSHLTGTRSEHWRLHGEECEDVIFRNFGGWVALADVVLYIFLLALAARAIRNFLSWSMTKNDST